MEQGRETIINNQNTKIIMREISDKELNQIMKEIGEPSKFTEEEYKKQWPRLLPLCEMESDWWDEMMDQHPEVKESSEKSWQEHCKKQAAEYFTMKILLRTFLEDHSLINKNFVLQGDFTLHYEDKKVTIKPVVPTGKKLEFKF